MEQYRSVHGSPSCLLGWDASLYGVLLPQNRFLSTPPAAGIEPGCPQGERALAPHGAEATLGAPASPLGQRPCAADNRRKPARRHHPPFHFFPNQISLYLCFWGQQAENPRATPY